MSLFPKNEWQEWARAWGMTHRAQKGWFARNESVVGLHDGVLVQAGWGGDKNAHLVVKLRYPRAMNPEGLRDALVADASLDALPGKGAGRKKMAVGTLKPNQVRWNQPEFLLDGTTLVWFRAPGLGGLKPRLVPEWVQALVTAVRRATPGFDGRCEECGTGGVRGFVLVDDVPMVLCGSCQQRLRAEGDMAERAYDMIEAQHLSGAIAAASAALVGAILWAGFAVLTDRMIAAGAIGIGLLVAVSYRWAARKLDLAGRVIGFVMTLGSVMLGQVFYYAWMVARIRPERGFRVGVGWDVYVNSWEHQPQVELFAVLFGLVGAWFASRALVRPRQSRVIREAGEAPEQRKAA